MPKNKSSKRPSAKGKISRNFGGNLWGKPSRREYKSGEHGAQTKRSTEFGRQVGEKNKLKKYYNMFEKQFKNLFKKAKKKKGDTAEHFVGLLERRLMTVVYRANFVPSIFSSRQVINHKQILVNEKTVNIGSYLLKVGDVISVKEKAKQNPLILEALQKMERDIPSYLEVDSKKMTIKFLRVPKIEEVPYPVKFNVNLIVEFYSR